MKNIRFTMRRYYPFNWLFLAALLLFTGCAIGNSRKSIAFVIPQGYVGWIRVKYNVPNALPLPIRNGYYLARIPANGLLKTSTVEDEGWGRDTFYYVTKTGGETRLPSDGSGPNLLVWGDSGRTNERMLFIGTKKQFDDAQRLIRGKDPGPLRLPITANKK